ncbi:hypothetical protein [Corynebacterium heidelbergense]|uniref:Uncharacterized protein n=1 Tax=Corynebacterium heidelbergense TaxID=2055947 RepID=A0A364VD05_9CORY|nr:hypothetical protein [Corynebacterium heidelbergense]RAV34510.1 hypothetical protein CWC39_03005 [Corynebacterium heidelbergense]WCZ36162.1 hypothetical protein CHEID_03010 [Corynebacterium heidelbergense]
MNLIVIDQDTGKRYLTAHQAAEAFGAKTTTYSACEARGYAPQPATYLRNRPLWNEDEVVDWDRTRAQ